MDPWRRLEQLDGWRVDWMWAPRAAGLTRWRDRVIELDIRLSERAVRCVLSHEVVHAERGPFPRRLLSREEEIVSRESARRLIDLHPLGEALAWSLHPHEAADELWVDTNTLDARIRGLSDAERVYLADRLEHHTC